MRSCNLILGLKGLNRGCKYYLSNLEVQDNNGPQFSNVLSLFRERGGGGGGGEFDHVTSSPRYPQPNDKAENETIQRFFTKFKDSSSSAEFLALLKESKRTRHNPFGAPMQKPATNCRKPTEAPL